MKKIIISIVSICVIIASMLCSCAIETNTIETNSRFVGEYIGNIPTYLDSSRSDGGDCMVEISKKMVLKSNGTGYYESKVSDSNNSNDFENGYLVSYYNLTWRVDDEYLLIDYNGKRYTRESGFNSFPYSDGKDDSFSATYELKANLLFELGEDRADYKKIN